MGFVYKIRRNFVEFQTEDNKVLKYFQPNQRQVIEISKAQGLEEILQANETLVRQNLEGEGKDEFIEALLENSTLEDFFTAMNEQFIKTKDVKRKN